MSKVSDDLRYTREHEWVLLEDDIATIGITDHAQMELGDITFVELPAVGAEFSQGDEVGTIESVKAASPYYAALTGKIIEVNSDLDDEPAAVNRDPYMTGWLYKISITADDEEIEGLMSADDYQDFVKGE